MRFRDLIYFRIISENIYRPKPKARFKGRILLMQMSENNRFFSFALDSAHVKCDVSNGPKEN